MFWDAFAGQARGLERFPTVVALLRSLIRHHIAPAFGIEKTENVLNVMSKNAFICTLDIAVKLVTLAQVRELDRVVRCMLCTPTTLRCSVQPVTVPSAFRTVCAAIADRHVGHGGQ